MTASTATTSHSSSAAAATVGTTTPNDQSAFVVRGPTGTNKVALTFHTNGDLGLAQRLFDVVKGRASITCFIVGNWLDANPTWAKKLLDAGHELANHTWSHPEFATLNPAAMATEIIRCRDTLVRLAGTPGKYFRPSGTDDGAARPSAEILRQARSAGYSTVLGWDVEPFDYKDPSATVVRTRVLDAISGGSIVSMHFGHTGTIDALSAILDGLTERKLQAVTVSDVLGIPR